MLTVKDSTVGYKRKLFSETYFSVRPERLLLFKIPTSPVTDWLAQRQKWQGCFFIYTYVSRWELQGIIKRRWTDLLWRAVKENWGKKRFRRRRESVTWRPGGRKDIKCLLITTESIPSSLFPSPFPFLCVRFALIHYSQAAAYWILTTWNSKDVEKHMWKHTERLINCDFCQKVGQKKEKERKNKVIWQFSLLCQGSWSWMDWRGSLSKTEISPDHDLPTTMCMETDCIVLVQTKLAKFDKRKS